MLYLRDRCKKGQEAAEKFMSSSNVYALLPKSISADGPAHVLTWRRDHGDTKPTKLDLKLVFNGEWARKAYLLFVSVAGPQQHSNQSQN